jgi:hypothetical protein
MYTLIYIMYLNNYDVHHTKKLMLTSQRIMSIFTSNAEQDESQINMYTIVYAFKLN